jgi:hypothetical protein
MGAMSQPVESRDKKAYFIRANKESDYQKFEQGVNLFGSETSVMPDGAIWYATYRDLPKDQALPPDYIQISHANPRGDIFAPHSRTTGFKKLRINKLPDVETAIRAMDHILEGQRGRETTQVTALAGRAHTLLDLFSQEFNTITNDQFIRARKKTEQILRDVHLNPSLIINQEKQRITAWILKASTGQDSLERSNKLITCMALSAAYRHAIEKYRGIGPILGKFTQIREALVFEREFDRTILTEVTQRIRPNALPADTMFKHPDYPVDRHVGVLLGFLHTTRFQLLQPHAAPYMPAGREAAAIIEKISQLLTDDKRQDILSDKLFARAHTIITNVLVDNQLIYPQSNG